MGFLMEKIRLLKNTVQKINRKMRQGDPGVYHPIDTSTPTGEIADRLSKLSIKIHIETDDDSFLVGQIDYLLSVLDSRDFDFSDGNYRMLLETNKSIIEMRKCLNDKLNDDGILNPQFEIDCKLMHVKTLLQESLVASISYHYDSK